MQNLVEIKKPLEYYDEQNGFYTLFMEKASYKYVNLEGKWIIDQIKENNDLNHLISAYRQQFSRDNNERDMFLYQFLQDLQDSGFIVFDSSLFSIPRDPSSIHIVGEGEYSRISEVIQQHLNSPLCLYTCSNDVQYYNPIFLRAKGFHNRENYFVEYGSDGKVKNVFGIQNLSHLKTPATISLIQAFDGQASLLSFYFECEKKLRHYEQFKIRVVLRENDISDLLFDFLNQAGFFCEAKLLKENGIDDLVVFSKMLEEL